MSQVTNNDNFLILLVDDRPENLIALEEILAQPGRSFIKASSGNEALKLALKHENIGLVMLDVQMPEMDGFEATAIIRNGNSSNKNLPIYALTADISAKDNNGYSNFFNGFLLKPLEIDKLHKALITPTSSI